MTSTCAVNTSKKSLRLMWTIVSLSLGISGAFLHPEAPPSRSFAFPPTPRKSWFCKSVRHDATSLASSASDTSTSSPTRPVSSLPKRKKNKKQKRTNSKENKSRAASKGRPISEKELVDHVSNLYLTGPGSNLRTKFKKQGVFDPRAALSSLEDCPMVQNGSTNNPGNNRGASLHSRTTLVLNADYQPISYLPLSVWHWQDAVKNVVCGKSTVVEIYQDVTIRAATLHVPLPSVIALHDYVPNKYLHQHSPPFTKRNVFLRDEYHCQYCAQRFHTRDLSLDHVIPRCRGGGLNWLNAVTCCKACNGRKGSMEVNQLHRVGMKLRREPRVPTQYELAMIAGRMRPSQVHHTWEPFLPKNIRAERGERLTMAQVLEEGL